MSYDPDGDVLRDNEGKRVEAVHVPACPKCGLYHFPSETFVVSKTAADSMTLSMTCAHPNWAAR